MGDRALCSGSTILCRLCYGPNEREGLMSPTETTENKFDLSTKLLGGSFVGLGIGLIGLFTGLSSGDKEPFLGWLWGCAFWLSIAIGMLMLIMIFRVFNSQWTPIVRRQLEHGLAAFPWLALCFAPLLLIRFSVVKIPAFFGRGSIPIASPMLLPIFRERKIPHRCRRCFTPEKVRLPQPLFFQFPVDPLLRNFLRIKPLAQKSFIHTRQRR